MNIIKSGIIFDKKYTYSYRDKYNEQCKCRKCTLFRSQFSKNYPTAVSFLSEFGVDVDYPLEIMDNGIDDRDLKRRYYVYYCVKGELPCNKIEGNIEDIPVTLRNWNIAGEAYANTGMDKPYFIIELGEITINDNRGLISHALEMGREIEFRYKDKNYFISRHKVNNWYLYCEQTKSTQTFYSSEDLLTKATLDNIDINSVWDEIIVDYIL